jgi:predicted PurR-regulated permease PerM
MRARWSVQTKVIVSLLLLALFVYLLFRFSVIIIPLILAGVLAFILTPLVGLLQNRLGVPRLLALILCYLLLLALAITLPVGVIPLLAAQISDLNLDVQLLLGHIEMLVDHDYLIAGRVVDGAALFQEAVLALQGLFEPVVGKTFEFVVDVISSIVWVIFVLVVSFYLIKDGPALRNWLEGLAPPALRADFIRLREEIYGIWAAFFRGQIVLALVVAIIFTVAGLILGLPFALALGLLAGLLEFLPSIGHGIWLAGAAVLAYFIGSTWLPIPNWVFTLIIVALHLFYQQFDLNYLIPRIIGRSVRLPPLVVILGIVAGAVFAGVLGILLAAPTIASARVLFRYLWANLFDLDPFSESVISPLPPPNPRWWRVDPRADPRARPTKGPVSQ